MTTPKRTRVVGECGKLHTWLQKNKCKECATIQFNNANASARIIWNAAIEKAAAYVIMYQYTSIQNIVQRIRELKVKER